MSMAANICALVICSAIAATIVAGATLIVVLCWREIRRVISTK